MTNTPHDPRDELTSLINRMMHNDRAAAELVLPLILPDLARLARRRQRVLRTQTSDLSTSDLVNELWLRLQRSGSLIFESRARFYAFASRALWYLLVDRARSARAHPGSLSTADSHVSCIAIDDSSERDTVLEVDELLEALDRNNPQQADIVRLRLTMGFELEEIAHTLGLPVHSVGYSWRMARAWLSLKLNDRGSNDA